MLNMYMIMIHKLYVDRFQTYMKEKQQQQQQQQLDDVRQEKEEEESNQNSHQKKKKYTYNHLRFLSSSQVWTSIDVHNDHFNSSNDDDDNDDKNNLLSTTTTSTSTATTTPTTYVTNVQSTNDRITFQTLHIPELKGVSQARRGYVLLLFTLLPKQRHQHQQHTIEGECHDDENNNNNDDCCCNWILSLSPMIRQNIAWITPIQYTITNTNINTNRIQQQQQQEEEVLHQPVSKVVVTPVNDVRAKLPISSSSSLKLHNENISSNSSMIDQPHQQQEQHQESIIIESFVLNIWSKIHINIVTNLIHVILRIDCYPKQYHTTIVQQIQTHCKIHLNENCSNNRHNDDDNNNNNNTDDINDDPFHGPITMTLSKSKCTHKLFIIILPSSLNNANNDNTNMNCYWGIECRQKATPTSRMMMDIPFNHEAAEEIIVVPGIEQYHHHTNNDTNNNNATRQRKSSSLYQQEQLQERIDKFHRSNHNNNNHHHTNPPKIIPLSRAYYKLYEIWYEYIITNEQNIIQQIWNTKMNNCNSNNTELPPVAAIDLGAAPGGWIQVLFHHMNVSYVVAIDKAQIPTKRIIIIDNNNNDDTSLPTNEITTTTIKYKHHLFHIPSTIENLNFNEYYKQEQQRLNDELQYNSQAMVIKPIHTPPTKFSFLVCDASVQWNILLPMIIQQLQLEQNNSIIQWTIPCIIIITLKLPFKTIHSIERHIIDIQQTVPKFIHQLYHIMYDQYHHDNNNHNNNDNNSESKNLQTTISVRYRIIHCMANSDSERTLIIIFEDKNKII